MASVRSVRSDDSLAVVDASVSAHDSVFVSGGRRGLEIELAPHDLVQLTDAALAEIARW